MVKQQTGLVSLITVTIASFFILVITTVMTYLMIGELRHAIDAENSVKAYYAAESGAEEGIWKVADAQDKGTVSDFDDDDFCQLTTSISGVTCQLINTKKSEDERNVDLGQTIQYDLQNDNVSFITIEWDEKDCWESHATAPCDGNPWSTQLPPPSGDAFRGPPPLEVSVADYDPGPISQKKSTVLLWPCSTVGCSDGDGGSSLADRSADKSTRLIKVACIRDIDGDGTINNGGNGRCRWNLAGLKPTGYRKVVLRLSPWYRQIRYHLRAYDSSSNPIAIKLDTVDIDVTAKVGDSYRRVEEGVRVLSNPFGGLNNTIQSDESICKDFNVLVDGAGNPLGTSKPTDTICF